MSGVGAFISIGLFLLGAGLALVLIISKDLGDDFYGVDMFGDDQE